MTPQNLKTIATGYMNIDDARIISVEYEHRMNIPQFKREIIKIWKYKNSQGNQKQVKILDYVRQLFYNTVSEKSPVWIAPSKRNLMFAE